MSLRVSVAAGRAAEQRGVDRRGLPAADDIAKPSHQLGSDVGHPFHDRCQQVVAVQRVEESVARLGTVDDAVLHKAI
jgi:hypothetical protein